jgi:hypothetical protein
LGLRLIQLLPDQFRRFAGTLALQMSGIAYFHLVIVDPQIDQIPGLAALAAARVQPRQRALSARKAAETLYLE